MSRRQEQRRKQAARQLSEDLAWLMDDARGRRVAWWLLSKLNAFGPLMTGNSQTFYNIGRRDAAIDLMAELRAVSLTNFRRMEDEVLSAQEIDALADSQPDDEPDA